MSRFRIAARAVLASTVVALALGVTPAGAGAAEQTIEVCGDQIGSLWDWGVTDLSSYEQSGSRWRMLLDCPGSILLNSVPGTTNLWGHWASTPAGWDIGRVKFKKVRFDIRGSDGSDGGRVQGVRACAAGGICTPLISPASSNEWQFAHHELSLVDGSLPVDTERFEISGWCPAPAPLSAESCAIGRELEIANIRLTFEDSTPPTIDLLEDVPDELPVTPRLIVDGWNSGTRWLYFQAADVESGVNRIEFKLNGAIHYSTSCMEAYSTKMVRLCPAQGWLVHEFASQGIGAKPGLNQLEAVAVDAAGNRSAVKTVHYMLDRALPIVSNLRATTAVHGFWQASRTVDLSWTNTPDTSVAEERSPIVKAQADVFEGIPKVMTKSLGGQPGIDELSGILLPRDGRFRFTFSVWDEGGNRSLPQSIEVGVDGGTPAAPVIESPPTLGSQQLVAGTALKWSPPAPTRSGTCGYALKFDQGPVSDPGTFMSVGPDESSAPLPTGLPHGPSYAHLRAISCAGVAGEIAHAAVNVDAAPPEIQLTEPAGGWYDFDNPLVASVGDAVGAEMTVGVDGPVGPWLAAGEISVPLSGGTHQVLIQARDAFGNVASRSLKTRFDAGSPSASFDPTDPTRPAHVRATAADPHSGVQTADLQYRREGESEWTVFGRSAHSGAPLAITIAGEFPDLTLEDGDYELRIVTTDAAGHRAVQSTRSDGSPARLSVPLRDPADVRVGFPVSVAKRSCNGRSRRRCATRQPPKLVEQRLVRYGTAVAGEGVLSDADGDPIGAAAVRVYESVNGAPREFVRECVTTADGRFSFRAEPGASRRITIRFPGSDTVAPGESELKLLVAGSVGLTVPRRARAGSSLSIRGRVRAPGINFPAGGQVRLQYELNGRFRQIPFDGMLDDMIVAADGTFTARLRFRRVGSPVRYRIRAVVPAPQPDWPYEQAVSRVRTVVVR